MDRIIKLPFRKIPDWVICVGLGLLLLVALLPVYRLAFYAFPYYDDFNYGINAKYAFEHGEGILGILESAKVSTDIVYNTWQGTYTSVFLMCLMPAAFGYQYYFIGIWAIITMFVAGIIYLSYTLCRLVFKATVCQSLNLAFFLAFLNVELFYEAQQGIYWYNCSAHYTFMHGLMFVLLAGIIRIFYGKRKPFLILHLALDTLLAAIVAGANFLTALQGLLIILFVFVIGIFVIKKKVLWILPPLVIYATGLFVNVAAPGNAVRQALYTGVAKGPVEAVLLSFASAFKNVPQFTGFPFWALFVAMIPICFGVGLNSKFDFKLPGLATLLSFCYYATGYTPSWYGMGNEGLARNLCVVKLVFLVLCAFNVVYWAGYLKKKLPADRLKKLEKAVEHKAITYVLSLALLLMSFAVSKNQAGSFMTYGAYYYVHTGEALNYYNEHLVMDTLIKEGGDEVALDPFIWRPWFLCKQNEIDTNPNMEQNIALARWYGKTAVYTTE